MLHESACVGFYIRTNKPTVFGARLGSDATGEQSDGEKKVIAVSGDSVELPSRHVLNFSPLPFSLLASHEMPP